jgi:hypothetical protein
VSTSWFCSPRFKSAIFPAVFFGKFSLNCFLVSRLYDELVHQREVIDLGCGACDYVIAMRDAGLVARGYDGNPFTEDISQVIN